MNETTRPPDLETMLEGFLDKAPWQAELFFFPEIRRVRSSIAASRTLRAQYEPTPEWYQTYRTEVIDNSMIALECAVDRTYNTIDLVRNIPFIGSYIAGWIENSVTSALNLPSFPQRQVAKSVLKGVKEAAYQGFHDYVASDTIGRVPERGEAQPYIFTPIHRPPETPTCVWAYND